MLVEMPPRMRSVEDELEDLFDSPKAFVAYLEELPFGSLAGMRCNAYACPLGDWLKLELGLYAVQVTGSEVYLWTKGPTTYANAIRFTLPPWSKYFINRVDSVDTRREAVSKHEAVNTMYEVMYYITAGGN